MQELSQMRNSPYFKMRDIWDCTELIANLFRISQTEEKLRKDNVQGAEAATSVHYNVGKEVFRNSSPVSKVSTAVDFIA